MTETRSTRTEKGLGQNGLYWKLCRRVARFCGRKAQEVHGLFKFTFNGNKSTKMLPVGEFHSYFEECQAASLMMWGISAFDEDKEPFTRIPSP
jgi:hypothetical protein